MSLNLLDEIKTKSGPHSVLEMPLHERAQADRAWKSLSQGTRQLLGGRSRWIKLSLAAAIAGVSYLGWAALPGGSVAATSAPSESLRSVKVASPTPVSTSDVVLPATFQPWQTTTLYARVSGYLTAWHRDLGSKVKAGELLAQIETPELDQELAEGESLAAEARAAVVHAQAERTEAEAELRVAQAQLARTEAQIGLSKILLARREKLLTQRAVSQEDVDTFRSEVEARTAEVAAAEADVARRRTSLDTRAAMIAAREATARSRESNVDRLKELQGFKKIVAPFDGVVTKRSAEVGMLVTAGKEALFVVEDMSRIRVQLNVPQTYSMQTRKGALATITLPESNLPAVEGKITRTAGSVDPVNRTMLAEIELENSDLAFQPGSYAKVSLSTTQAGKQWTIPTNTLSMRIDGPHVAVVNNRDEIEMKSVRLGRDLGTRVVVVEGIQGDERLVVNPGDDLANGRKIQVGGGSKNASGIAKR